MPDETARLAVVEDHGVIATALAVALRSRGHEVLVVDPGAGDRGTAVTLGRYAPDLVLHDLDLGDEVDGVDRVAAVVAAGHPVLVVTGVGDPVVRARAVAAGAVGVVDKAAPFDELVAVVTATLTGQPPLTPHEREEHLAAVRRHDEEARRRVAPFADLTERESAVLQALVDGHHVRDIAAMDSVSTATVRSHVRGVLTKLGVTSQLEAVALAHRSGWADAP